MSGISPRPRSGSDLYRSSYPNGPSRRVIKNHRAANNASAPTSRGEDKVYAQTRAAAARQGSQRPATSRGTPTTVSRTAQAVPRQAQPAALEKKEAPRGNAPQRQQAGPTKKKSRWQRMGKRQRANLVIGLFLVTLTLSVSAVALVQGYMQVTGQTDDVLPSDSSYVPAYQVFSASEYAGTILAESEDAGEEYVNETLFLGDSNTLRMVSYSQITGVTHDNAIGVVGMGIQSMVYLKCASFQGLGSITMPSAVKVIQPRRVVITFGTNNVGASTVETFIEWYGEAIDAVKEAYPYTDIILGAIFPVDRYHNSGTIRMANIEKYNVALAALATRKECKFLNWSDALRDADTGFCQSSYTVEDGIHLSGAGMEQIIHYFRTHSYITEDTRPKPLQTVPKRLDKAPGQEHVYSGQSNTAPKSASQNNRVTVVFGSAGGGFASVSGGSATVYVAPGTLCPSATAIPNQGYEFSHWEVGGVAVQAGRSMQYTLPASSRPGSTVYITAFFTKVNSQPAGGQQGTGQQPADGQQTPGDGP